jgi:hypothetical protein
MLDALVRVALVGATGLLFSVILLAYRRTRFTKMAFIAAGFGIFFVHAFLFLPEIMFASLTMGFTETAHLALLLLAMLFITIGVLKD